VYCESDKLHAIYLNTACEKLHAHLIVHLFSQKN